MNQAQYQQSKDEYLKLGGRIDSEDKRLSDDSPTYGGDPHYMFMGMWAFEQIRKHCKGRHVDVGGQVTMLGYLTRFVPVLHVDVRTPMLTLCNFAYMKGSVLDLKIPSGAVESLSCLHVLEHVGLGRYGDDIDPDGFNKACKELRRVLKPGGMLYIAFPVGQERTVFNAHRVIPAEEIQKHFGDMELVNMEGITTEGSTVKSDMKGEYDIMSDPMNAEEYGCGCYAFRNPSES